MKRIDGALVRAMNDAGAGIALSESRCDELTIELEQLRAATESVATKVVFDADPADFRVALMELAKEAKRD